ncbi:hypothetical protein ABIC11_003825 [Pseudomonas oryzihabitans]
MHDGEHLNPLGEAQREHAGSTTYNAYEYQYHWALCRIVSLHAEGCKYVVFVEYHEDVIVADGLDSGVASFEFNQIKKYAGKPWKETKLTERKKAGNTRKPSILANLISGVRGKGFFDKLKSLNLVNTSGYDLGLSAEGLKLSVVSVGSLSPEGLGILSQAMLAEIGDSNLPPVLNFVRSDLGVDSFQDISIGRISRLLESKYPSVGANAVSIYLALMDDLRRKGAVEFDFLKWNECVQKKGLTSSKFEAVVELYSSQSLMSQEKAKLLSLLELSSAPASVRLKLMQVFGRYYAQLRLETSLPVIKSVGEISEFLDGFMSSSDIESIDKGFEVFIDTLERGVGEETKLRFPDQETLRVAILYELSRKFC